LTRDFLEGEQVYRYDGWTYGCIGDGIAVSRELNAPPFLELPGNALEGVKRENISPPELMACFLNALLKEGGFYGA
jgi:hypothetical protein